RRELDRDRVDARAVVRRALDVVAAVGQQQERALIALRRAVPGGRIDGHAGGRAEGLAELVALVGRQATDGDEALVDEGLAVDGESRIRPSGERHEREQREGGDGDARRLNAKRHDGPRSAAAKAEARSYAAVVTVP